MERRAEYAAAAQLLKGAKRVLISGHSSPDGDSLGSMIALARMLTAAGIEAVATADPNAIGRLAFVEGAELLLPPRRLKRRRFDLFVAVDCSDFSRMPAEVAVAAAGLPRLCFDHHETNDGTFAPVTILDRTASSTGEMIWRFAKWMEWPLDRVTAEALWVALVTDTGRFAHDCTHPSTLLAAADLLKRGVRTSLINDMIFGEFSRKAIELKRIAWRSLHIWKNRKVAEVSLSIADFRAVRGKKSDAEDTVEIPRSVAKNKIALFFYQIPDRTGETRCSIRTRAPYKAVELAKRFGGGGHEKAAACTFKCSLSAAKRTMRRAVKEYLAEGAEGK